MIVWLLLLVFSDIAALLLIGLLVHRWLRRRQIAAELGIESPRGIVEELFVVVGGIPQWIGVRGDDQENPVLLIVHGGPGSSCSIFTPRIRSWEAHFTVAQWDHSAAAAKLSATRAAQARVASRSTDSFKTESK